MEKTITITGSYGRLIVNAETGEVIEYLPDSPQDTEYADITHFDLAEYRTWCADHKPKWLTHDETDILLVGFHHNATAEYAAGFEPPCADSRHTAIHGHEEPT